MRQTSKRAGQYICGSCGKAFTSIVELHQHEKSCRNLEPILDESSNPAVAPSSSY